MRTFRDHFIKTGPVLSHGVIESGPLGGAIRFHSRPDYTAEETLELSQWLNEREAGYPVKASLEHLTRNAAHEQARRPRGAGKQPSKRTNK